MAPEGLLAPHNPLRPTGRIAVFDMGMEEELVEVIRGALPVSPALPGMAGSDRLGRVQARALARHAPALDLEVISLEALPGGSS